jgi:hypothetical protein
MKLRLFASELSTKRAMNLVHHITDQRSLLDEKNRFSPLITEIAPKFCLPSGSTVITAANMKCAAVFSFLLLAFVSQTFAVVRPLFPVKPEPPLGGAIVIGDDLAQNPSKNSPPTLSR